MPAELTNRVPRRAEVDWPEGFAVGRMLLDDPRHATNVTQNGRPELAVGRGAPRSEFATEEQPTATSEQHGPTAPAGREN